jgi:hypothetical protein
MALLEEELRRWPGQQLPGASCPAFEALLVRLLVLDPAAAKGSLLAAALSQEEGLPASEQPRTVLQQVEAAVEGLAAAVDWRLQLAGLWQAPEVQLLGFAYLQRVLPLLRLLQSVQEVSKQVRAH